MPHMQSASSQNRPHMTHDPECPACHERDNKVLETRRSMAGSVRRHRICICTVRFTTYEQVDRLPRLRSLLISLGLGRDVSS